MNTRFYITHKVNKLREVGFAVIVVVVAVVFLGSTFVVFAFADAIFVITVVTLVAFTSQ